MNKVIISSILFGLSATTQAAFPTGQWTAKLWSDTNAPTAVSSFKICIETGGDFHVQINPIWNGKWFLKGNDIHLISVHSSGLFGFSLDVTKVNNNTLSGYYQWVGYSSSGIPSQSEFDTTIMSFDSTKCTF